MFHRRFQKDKKNGREITLGIQPARKRFTRGGNILHTRYYVRRDYLMPRITGYIQEKPMVGNGGINTHVAGVLQEILRSMTVNIVY